MPVFEIGPLNYHLLKWLTKVSPLSVRIYGDSVWHGCHRHGLCCQILQPTWPVVLSLTIVYMGSFKKLENLKDVVQKGTGNVVERKN